ncbi:unnamed protein product [Plutella xylostella]|uniref:(diamondback moth) hypothetical protein n=1 Tax=Plutella xylostella TaxID=51655 RepID=A0A8S4G2T1_PLUXY|nr:unnamed protein product [Plutella xylostella]
MLHRTSSSSKRRRASRSAAASPAPPASPARSPRASAAASRRASLATTDTDDDEPAPPAPAAPRSPRASLAPGDYARSPRHSLAPDPAPERRASLAPSRNNLAVDAAYGSRLSLNPQDFNRSPRNSITPDMAARSPRRSLVPEGTAWAQPRGSLAPDVGRSPRHSVASIQLDPARQKELGPSPRTSPRGAAPEPGRSPRGSLVPDPQRSPRGSIASARGSLVPDDAARASPRGSLTLTFQEPLVSRERRASEDSTTAAGRGRVSPYRASLGGGAGRSALSDNGSRRASSSVSQVSGDEQRRLCGEQAKFERSGLGLGVGLTTYGSVAYQLKDANMEATGTVDFVCRAARIMNRTILMTVFLACLSTLPVVMLIMAKGQGYPMIVSGLSRVARVARMTRVSQSHPSLSRRWVTRMSGFSSSIILQELAK